MKISKLIITAALLFAASILSAQDVDTGIDVLKEQKFKILEGKRVGLITNPTGFDQTP
ncbi:hypothetical protein MASR2M69_22580 [Bacteroidota bacterium]